MKEKERKHVEIVVITNCLLKWSTVKFDRQIMVQCLQEHFVNLMEIG